MKEPHVYKCEPISWRQHALLEAYGDDVRSTTMFAMARLKDAIENLWVNIMAAWNR